MGDLIKESIVAMVLLITTFYLWNTGRKNKEISNNGLQMILAGFVFLTIGHIVDALDDIWFIETYVESTIVEEVLENLFGEIISFVLIAYGVITWMPTIASINVLENEVKERRDTQEELNKKTSKLTGLLNSIPDMVFFKDMEGKYLGCNPSFSDFINYPSEHIVGKSIHDIFPKEKADELYQQDTEVISSGKVMKYEVSSEACGDKRYYETIKAPLYDSEGTYLGLVGISRDVTNYKEIEELNKARIKAETASNTKSEFLATMSHELRTPLNSIIGFSDVMLSGMAGNVSDQQEKYLKNIAVSGKHLLELINNILDLSKSEAGKMELEPDQFKVDAVINEVLGVMSPIATKKKVELKVENTDPMIIINADKLRFKQIIYNLMSNAVKFTPEGGSVRVLIKAYEDLIRIEVADTGIGVSEEDMHLLFEPFKQIDHRIERRYEGTGLGLALVKNFVELHGGKIWVESKVGEGSTFIFEIPDISKEN
ncbi:PAS domain-containing sensor histidine kinase [Methanolobus profundi]|uniref:histidine kinase n=1 Tax=Methanolobus profundi TaxID=487685 RepID=A0A1I4RFW2_9EURY|nr:ATP-binding protein [Methanolobus profundi]SFM50820.1 PAS domain S-box-containing protein [Methanolobus profundi]